MARVSAGVPDVSVSRGADTGVVAAVVRGKLSTRGTSAWDTLSDATPSPTVYLLCDFVHAP